VPVLHIYGELHPVVSGPCMTLIRRPPYLRDGKTINWWIRVLWSEPHTLKNSVLVFVWIQVQYRKSVKNVTFSRTNHDFFVKKEHFFYIKNIFDSKKKNIFSTIMVLDLNLFFFRVFVLRVHDV
jgi:hypothetical protein